MAAAAKWKNTILPRRLPDFEGVEIPEKKGLAPLGTGDL
jgi:hypothetical protein